MNTQSIILNNNWKFQLGDTPDAWYKGFCDDAWEAVSLPHDWSVSLPFSTAHSSGTGYLAGGIGWYRGTFHLPESCRGKRISLLFDGVYKNSQVWCNSYYLGKRPNGYTEFDYDISAQASFGDIPNVICVKVTHTDISDSRWFTGSGITRKVTVCIQEPVHPTLNGIVFRSLDVSNNSSAIEVDAELINEGSADCSVAITSRLYAADGTQALVMTGTETLLTGERKTALLNGTVHNPLLWSVDTPNLYEMVTTLSVNGGETYEVSRLHTGIRTFRFDPDNGFFLNDRSMKLKGVCVHHDAGCLGAAVLFEVWQRRLSKLKAMGCNAIRTSHNPHMPELYDLCDRMGFLMIDEAFDEWENAKNKWSTGHNVYPPKHQGYYEDFPQWHEADLTALIKRDRNHPSVILWSIGNEIDYPNDPYCHPLFQSMTGNNDANKPDAERMYTPNKPNMERLSVIASELSAIVRKTDATRPVTLAAAFPELSSQLGFFDSLDVVGYNYKEHLYAEDHLRFPNKPFLGSENGHSYEAYRAVTDHDYISGQFLWTGIDFLGEALGWPVHGSRAGLLTTAGFEKPDYYRRQAMWAESPVVHIATCRTAEGKGEWLPLTDSFNYVPGEEITVRVYTNLPTAELFLNDYSCGRKTELTEYGCLEWQITYETGVLSAIGYDALENRRAEHCLETTGAPCRILLSVWENDPAFCIRPEVLKQIEVTVADANGRRVLDNSSLLNVSVQNGTLAGIENGDLADNTAYTVNYRHTYDGNMILYVRCSEDGLPTVVTVSGGHLKDSQITI